MSGSLKKIIWMICMMELCILHMTILAYLYLHGRDRWVVTSIAGTVIMAFGEYLVYRRFIRMCVKDLSLPNDEQLEKAFAEANIQAGNRRENANRIYTNPGVHGPFVMGFIRQAVIFPGDSDYGENLSRVLLHECIHVKRHDTLYKYIMLVCNCFVWFHPLAYFFRYISYRDIEIACDEAVVRGKTREERYAYGRFLIESARQQQKGQAYSAYWNDSKAILKRRIQAIMGEERKWDLFARVAVVVLVLEVVGLAVCSSLRLHSEYQESTKPVNEFEGAAPPPIYTEEALQGMLNLQPVAKDTYRLDYFQPYMDMYPERQFADIEVQPDGPWQFRVENPGRFKDALGPAIQRFWYYTQNQEGFHNADYERSPMYATYETVYSQLLAGDIQDAVWGIIWKAYTTEYAYYSMAVHIRMVEPYLFEVEGYADLEETIAAYQAKYPDVDLSYFPSLENSPHMEQEEHQKLSEDASQTYTLIAKGDGLWVETDTAEAIEVPVAKTLLQDPGDPLTGAGNEIREECYQCDGKKIIFAYSRRNDTQAAESGVAVAYYEYGTWKESAVTGMDLFKLYVVFPENEEVGYVYGVAERVAFQEACVLFRTADGGKTWEEIEMSENAAQHSLTMDFDFLTDQIGYLAIHSSSEGGPKLLRTDDGGVTWEPVIFDEVPEYFCQAYAPEMQDGKEVLYVGMEDYSERKGEKAYYESTDGGKSWNYQGQVIRQ